MTENQRIHSASIVAMWLQVQPIDEALRDLEARRSSQESDLERCTDNLQGQMDAAAIQRDIRDINRAIALLRCIDISSLKQALTCD